MQFKRIELNGFKSFADPVTIEFTDGITCIVGPNGSGKSNISDAILWVLGEQSPKSLRSDKLEEVIFSGTQSRKAKGMAEVTLVIDNTDHSLPIDFTEVGITRRAYRSGENEYMINRRPCRLKDIRELIMDTGIGVEGYSMVGQGKIADIVSNKMERRREIFEEAAGIVKYRTKKEKTEKSLEQAVINLSRVTDIINEIESRIGGLEEDSRKATEYLEIKDKYKDIEINIILKNIEAADAKTFAVEEELAELAAQAEQLESGRAQTESALKEQREKAAALDERLGALRDGLLAATERIHDISGREEINKERLASLGRDEERLSAEIAALNDKAEKEKASSAQTEQQLAEAEKEAKDLAAQLEEKRRASAEAQKQLEEKESELASGKNDLFDISGRIQSARTSAENMSSLKETLEKRASRLEEESGLKDKNDKELAERTAAAEKELAEIKTAGEKNDKRLKDALLSQNKAEERRDRAAEDAQSIRVAMGKAAARLNLLDELEKAYEGYGGAVKFLMAQRPAGIIGTLGELLRVPKGYETAIETVLGAKLQNIVCKDDASAKSSVELLKKNKAGRLTFLPLADLKVQPPLSVKDLEGRKGFLGLASDIVSIKEGCECIVDYVLGNVAVVDDLDDALKISAANKGPHKFVTLEGEVINAAGAITGGSFKNNTADILSRRAETDALRAETAELGKKLDRTETELKKAEKDIQDAADEKHRAEDVIRGADLRAAILERDIQLLKQAATDAAGAEDRRLAELAELRQEIAASEKQTADWLAKADALEEQKTQLEASAAAASEAAEEAKSRLAYASAQETSVRLQENSARIKAENAAELVKLSKQTLEDIASQKSEKERALESVRIQTKQIADYAEGAGDVLANAEEERSRLEKEIEAASAEKRAASDLASSLEEEKNTLDKQIYDVQIKKHDADIRAARADSQTESLKERLWQEYEMSYAEAAAHEDPEFVMSRALKESREYKERLRALGDVNVGAIEEYKQVKERYDFLSEQKADAQRAMDELRDVINEMDTIIRKRFKESFDSIVVNFEQVFTELFKGGHAALTMTDPEHPLESAIEIEAQPPGKKLQNISLLSGGERTLTALALMFAVLRSKPTPFCILDEVEAALDEANIDAFAKYVKKFDNTQFALVTHQKLTMEYADALYGVTMPEQGISKILSLRLGDDFEV
ncbi:MAG: chromosome segregation protein SMC [Firmicutes bacterium]|nr:chromosome segregation protein SMC [Bacillota bacterium]